VPRVRPLTSPIFIEPMLPSLVAEPPVSDNWQHEIKHDGYRTQLVIDRGQVRAFTRNRNDWTDRYPGIVAAAEDLRCRSAVMDGEVIVQDENGHSDFGAIRYAMANAPHRLVFFAFDAPFLNGEDLRDAPLEERPSYCVSCSINPLTVGLVPRPVSSSATTLSVEGPPASARPSDSDSRGSSPSVVTVGTAAAALTAG